MKKQEQGLIDAMEARRRKQEGYRLLGLRLLGLTSAQAHRALKRMRQAG